MIIGRSSLIVVLIALVAVSPAGNHLRWCSSARAQFTGTFGATRFPAIDVDTADRLYLAMSVATSPTGGPHSQIFFTWSVDGGVTWDNLPRTRNLSSSPGEAFGPSIAVKAIVKARAYIVYHDNTNGPSQAYLVRSKKKTNFRPAVNISPGAGGAFSPRIAVDSSEGLNIVWGDTATGGRRVVFVRSTDLGFTFTGRLDISKSSGFAFEPEIALDRNDAINVVWEDTAPGNSVIMFTRSTDHGTSFSPPAQVSQTAGDASEAHVAVDGSGRIHVVWVDDSDGDHQILYARSTDNGVTFSPAINISSLNGADTHKAVVTAFANVVYVSYDEHERTGQVFLARSDDGGVTFGRAAQVSDANQRRGQAHSPAMVRDSRGTLHLVWIDSSILGSDEGILLYSKTTDGRTFQTQRIIFAAL